MVRQEGGIRKRNTKKNPPFHYGLQARSIVPESVYGKGGGVTTRPTKIWTKNPINVTIIVFHLGGGWVGLLCIL